MNYQVLDVDLSFRYEDLRIVIPVIGTLISFVIYWFSWRSEKLSRWLIARNGEDLGSVKLIVYTKILGGLCMALLPAGAYLIAFPDTRLAEFGWMLSRETLVATVAWIIGLGLLIATVIGLNAGKPANLKHYPQIRARKWTRSMVNANLLGWAVYLLGYEALFRGVLFFPWSTKWGYGRRLPLILAFTQAHTFLRD